MNRFFVAALAGVLVAVFSLDAEAQRRLGGGRTIGRQSPTVQQRQATPPAQQPAPAQQATPAQQPAGAQAKPAAAPASPWKGALLGLAAGLGLAALASYFGFSETLTAVLMAALLATVLLALLGFVMRRMRGGAPQPAYGGVGAGASTPYGPEAQPAPVPAPMPRAKLEPTGLVRPGSAMDEFARAQAAADTRPWGVPTGFDTAGFLENAKVYFRRLQDAWSRGDLKELEEFTTQEMFVALTHELRAQAPAAGSEVQSLEAALLGIESAATEHLASVRFTGSLLVDGQAEQVDEVWNLSKPLDGSAGWLLAGIQQLG